MVSDGETMAIAKSEPVDSDPNWTPPFTFEERLKYTLLPPRLYMAWRAAKEWRRGEAEIRLLSFLVDATRNSVDVGANKGVYSHFLAKYSKQVYAFEPNPKMFGILCRCASSNVTASPCALSNRNGEALLRLPKRKGGYSNQLGSLNPAAWDGAFATVTVETRTLDSLGLSDVGFIKIDVEGFELQVLEGAARTIARDRPTLLVEIEERHTGQPIEQSLDIVEALGYRCMIMQRGRLADRSRFDPDRQHRNAGGRDDYVFNFIFLPLENSAAAG